MNKLAQIEKTILFMNNMAGDDLMERGYLLTNNASESDLPHELFKYKNESSNGHGSNGIYLTSLEYSNGRNEKIHLYGFPFLHMDIDPSDIEYPDPISGVVVTQDMRMLDFFLEQDENFHHITNLHTSRLAWAKQQSLPVVLAVHHAEKHRGNMQELSRLVGMDVFCPVVWHTGKLNADFFRKAIKSLLTICRPQPQQHTYYFSAQ